MTIGSLARFALLGLSLLLTASDSDRLVQPAPANVLIITLDTTRADVLAAYGGTIVETPAIDRLAREGTVFEQASTSVPLTLPAHASLFTGLFPHHHRVHDNTDVPLDGHYPTLAEVFRAKGVHSAAFVASAVLDSRRGLARGFDTYSEGHTPRPSSRLRRRADVVASEAID
jgi:arylsulfatase A-like enzyme